MEAELPGQQDAVQLGQPQQSGTSTGLNFTRAHSTGTPNDWGSMLHGRVLPEPGTSLATTLSGSLTHSYRERLVQGLSQGTGPQTQQQQAQLPPPPRHTRRASWAPSPNSQVGFAVGQPAPAAQQQSGMTVLLNGRPGRPSSAGPVAPAGLTAASSQQQSGSQPLPRVRFEDRVPFGSPFGASPSGQGALGAELALQQREAAAAVAATGDRPAGGSDDEGSVIDRNLSGLAARRQRQPTAVADSAQASPWDRQWAGSAPAQSSGIPASGVGAGQGARQQAGSSSLNAQFRSPAGPVASFSSQASTRQPEVVPPQTSHAPIDAADLLAQRTGARAGAANAPAAQQGEPSSRDRSTAAWVPVGSQGAGGGHGTLWSQPTPPEQVAGPVPLTAGAVRAAHAAAGGFQAAPAAVVPEVPPVQAPAAQLPAGELWGCLIRVCAIDNHKHSGLGDFCRGGRHLPEACSAQWQLQPVPGLVCRRGQESLGRTPCCCWPVFLHVAALVMLQPDFSCASLTLCDQAAGVHLSFDRHVDACRVWSHPSGCRSGGCCTPAGCAAAQHGELGVGVPCRAAAGL